MQLPSYDYEFTEIYEINDHESKWKKLVNLSHYFILYLFSISINNEINKLINTFLLSLFLTLYIKLASFKSYKKTFQNKC